MRIFVAILHAIGEDNDGNTSIVATSREALDQKLLDYCNIDYDDEGNEIASTNYANLDEAWKAGVYHWIVNEHDLE